MRIDYNQLFCRENNSLDFIFCDTGVKYNAYVAGIITQRFGGVSYELGISGSQKHEIYNSLNLLYHKR